MRAHVRGCVCACPRVHLRGPHMRLRACVFVQPRVGLWHVCLRVAVRAGACVRVRGRMYVCASTVHRNVSATSDVQSMRTSDTNASATQGSPGQGTSSECRLKLTVGPCHVNVHKTRSLTGPDSSLRSRFDGLTSNTFPQEGSQTEMVQEVPRTGRDSASTFPPAP